MNRFHVHLNVADLDGSIRFYSELFASPPSVRKADYAKWMLEDPRVNFAISNTGRAPGIDHLWLAGGFGRRTLRPWHPFGRRRRHRCAGRRDRCCYARSDKLWTEDPQGTRWETFHTFGDATTYYAGEAACATDGAACTPSVAAMKPKVDTGASCCSPEAACC